MKYLAPILLSAFLAVICVEGSDFRIIHGKPAPPTPHHIALFQNGDFNCGGSLIGNRTILTAGHCVFFHVHQAGIYRVHYGSSEYQKGIEASISNIIVHPLFKYYKEPEYDVAILHLAEPFNASAHASIIPMVSTSPAIGSFVNITGWGRSGVDGPFASTLQIAENMIVVNHTVCQADWPHIHITERILCAENAAHNQGICGGDSGSGLTQNGHLVGVASFASIKCTDLRYPNGFADVASVGEFIQQHLL